MKISENILIALFGSIDAFCQRFEPEWNRILLGQNTTFGRWWTTRESKLLLSELMTIAVFFHSSGYRTFQHYYDYFVSHQLLPFFPNLVSYKHFNKLMKKLGNEPDEMGIKKERCLFELTIIYLAEYLCKTEVSL